jgi:hypothetical protein
MEVPHQRRQRQQILEPEGRAPSSHADERIDRRDIRPTYRQ